MMPLVLLLTLHGVCDGALERAVASRLRRDAGTWLIHCVDDANLEITRIIDGSARARVIPLSEVTPALRVKVAVLAAAALLVPSVASAASTAPSAAPPVEAHPAAEAAPGASLPANLIVDRVVVPRAEEGSVPPFRGAPWQRAKRSSGPFALATGRVFPGVNTWLVGAGGGVELGALRLSLIASGSEVKSATFARARAGGPGRSLDGRLLPRERRLRRLRTPRRRAGARRGQRADGRRRGLPTKRRLAARRCRARARGGAAIRERDRRARRAALRHRGAARRGGRGGRTPMVGGEPRPYVVRPMGVTRSLPGSVAVVLGVAAALSTLPGGCSVPIDVGGELADGGSDGDAEAAGDAGDGSFNACTKDETCGSRSICSGGRCSPCPDPSSCPTPLNQEPLRRNGCAMCEFAPASQCAVPADCASGAECVRGVRCAAGCTEISCCANTCAAPGCKGPAPVGCAMTCESFLGCTTCVASKCRCNAGSWECVAGCTSHDFVAGCTL